MEKIVMRKFVSYLKLPIFFCSLILLPGPHPCFAQTSVKAAGQQASAADQQIPPAVAKKLEAMEARIEQLEAELKARPVEAPLSAKASTPVPPAPPVATSSSSTAATSTPLTAQAQSEQAAAQSPAAPGGKVEPFSDADWTWLNGNPRTKDIYWDTKFFTPEIRTDTDYVFDFNHPTDHSMGGSSELFRSQEVQLEQLGIGGDFHYDNVRARFMTQFGMYSATTPRNDPSPGHGQWDLVSAYRYLSEAYGGYHFNALNGVNVDAGIFLSYIGLFSYYNFDNWAYQPSYVSSNTPWFFNGLRIQYFPTNKLKIEPWFINGWQSYAKYNGHPGLGGQLLWLPKEWFKLVANQYGYGEDNLGLPKTQRIHTDDSIEVRYYSKPENSGLSKMAFSLTGDAGCQYGGGITCHGGPNKSSFLGWMLYNRWWFHKDTFSLTLGGGEMSNARRYLTLLPPIDGAWAAVGSAYFPETPGSTAFMYDGTLTLQYMPKQYITWWAELGYRHSNVPYFSGRGGITPPGGNNGLPQYFTCMNGTSSGTGALAAAQAGCGGANDVWYPDLRESTSSLGFGVMVKF